MSKVCTLCRVEKSGQEFHKASKSGAPRAECRACTSETNAKRQKKKRQEQRKIERMHEHIAELSCIY